MSNQTVYNYIQELKKTEENQEKQTDTKVDAPPAKTAI
jgi:hypothetical protein